MEARKIFSYAMAEFKRNLAVVIGINQYVNGLPELRSPVNDATRLAEILQKNINIIFCNYLDREATLDKLNNLLAPLKQQALPLPKLT